MDRTDIRFGEELRRWRTLRGKTQSDVAARSGYSQRHVSFLEIGRSRPTRESVLVLAETLDVPVQERNTLLLSAGFAPSYSEHAMDSDQLTGAIEALRSLLDSSRPFPAMLIDRTWNVYAVNPNMGVLLQYFVGDRACLDQTPVNAVELCLAEDGLRDVIENWREFGRTFMNLIRRDLSYDPTNERLRTLLTRLEADPRLTVRNGQNPAQARAPVSLLTLAKGGVRVSLLTIVSSFEEPNDATLSNLRVETFFPFDEASRELLHAFDAEVRDGGRGSARDN